MSSFILIDTNIWHFALVKPIEEPFWEIHKLAREFLSSIIGDSNLRIAVSCYQVSEILEVLRRSNLSVDLRLKLLEDFEKGKFFVKPLDFPAVVSAVKDSAKSNIHIYDYLVAYPLKEIVNRIYSADSHFKHPHFQSIAEVKNPISPWIITEGKKPEKTS
ncbi:MAG: type II toxin-antitoxin system VapC family toxin [Candidatus Jordarchaeum sp.]|uniref:type II toxin-antitoxin system VapC family toxin n=1 Tax=Candidatus Jordarchaeum sp. TaxID=2823881 RepID=UPI00404B33FA